MASFVFTCPACGTRLCSEAVETGARARCPQCEIALQVPEPHLPPVPTGESDAYRQAETVLVADEVPVDFRSIHREHDAEMDMTPMVDVTFLLLIFFMVTAAFTMQKSFEVPTPDNEQASRTPVQQIENDSDYVMVKIDEYNTFHVSAAVWDEEKEAPSQQDLLVRLKQAHDGSASAPGATRMLVMANGQAYYDKVVQALDAGQSVGMEDVKLVTVEED